MIKNLSENALLRIFLVRGTEEMWIGRFWIDWNLEKWGVLKEGLRGLPMEPVTVHSNHAKIEALHLKNYIFSISYRYSGAFNSC